MEFSSIIPNEVKLLSRIFDFENLLSDLVCFSYDNGKISISREERIKWEMKGAKEFAEFHGHVCELPHVKGLADADPELNLVPHCSQSIYLSLKTALKRMVWQGFSSYTQDVCYKRRP